MSFDPNAIGNRIFTLRTNAKLSQEKLAEKLGVSHRHLGDLERGSSNGSVKILIDIAEYFHVSMDYLLLGRDPSRDQFQNELQAAIDHLEKIAMSRYRKGCSPPRRNLLLNSWSQNWMMRFNRLCSAGISVMNGIPLSAYPITKRRKSVRLSNQELIFCKKRRRFLYDERSCKTLP